MNRMALLVAVLGIVACDNSEGRYAAWVSFDVGLLALSVALSALVAAALTALLSRTTDRRHLILGWLIGFILTFIVVIVVMNAVTPHPVFVVETAFPFP